MTARAVRLWFWAIVAAGAIARVVAWRTAGGMHPDEFFQALEPAWCRINGVGMITWEWREGIRSWVLPGYNGAWLALLRSLGVERGHVLASIVQLHWALVSLVLIGAAFRGGAFVTRALVRSEAQTGWQGGLLAAGFCALFPPIVTFSCHTLSELPSMLCFASGIALAAELSEREPPARRRAFGVGLLLGLGLCLRIVNAPLVLFAPLLLGARRKLAHLTWVAAGALAVVVVFGAVDYVTWGKFLGSYIAYVKHNVVMGEAAGFGTAPWWWYFDKLFERAPLALPIASLFLIAGRRGAWPFAMPALALVVALSTQAHKEERFVIAFWPLVLMGAAGTLGAAIATGSRWRRWARAACPVAAASLIVDPAFHTGGEENSFARAWLDGQVAAGAEAEISGLLIDSAFFNGGALWFGRSVPQLEFKPALLDNALVSHALVRAGSENDRRARDAGFRPIEEHGAVVLLRRRTFRVHALH